MAAAEVAIQEDPSTALDAELAAEVQKIQPEREQADYDAWSAPAEEAQRTIELADRFLTAIEALLD
jgi:hypothetical protein